MANEIKYLSYEGLRHFWQDKLKPEIEANELVVAASLVDLDDRLTTHTHTQYAPTSHTHTYVASAGYSASAARATYSASAGYVARVHLNSGYSSMWYPMVFTNTKTPTTGAQLYMDSHTDTTSTATGIRYNPSTNRCYCSGGFYEASDERLKNFGNDIEVDLDKLLKLSKKYFTWKDDKSNTQHIGISAQELQELYPEIVNVIDEDGHLSVSYDKLSVVALKGIDVLNDKITSLEKRLDKLEGKLNIAQ